MNKNFFKIYFLLILIMGCLIFITSIAYWSEDLLIISLSTMMIGSVGFYLLDNMPNPKNSPFVYKGKKVK